jgi:hypothetical protein
LSDTIPAKIDRFVTFYSGAVESAASLKEHRHGAKLRKICVVAILDAVSKAIFPTRRNKSRFTELVKRFGAWSDCRRVSLPHLQALLAQAPDPQFESLRLLVNEALASWISGTIIRLDQDLEYDEVRALWPKDQNLKTPVGRIVLEDLQHLSLLYFYRNALVHEFRELAAESHDDDRTEPHYVHAEILEVDDEWEMWQLYYPSGFFHVLAGTVLENVREYLLKNNLDPMRHFSTSRYWLEELRH